MLSEHPVLNWLGNLAAVTTIAGTIVGWLPVFAALVAIGWYLIQIYESRTFNAWRRKRLQYKITRAREYAAAMEAVLSDMHKHHT